MNQASAASAWIPSRRLGMLMAALLGSLMSTFASAQESPYTYEAFARAVVQRHPERQADASRAASARLDQKVAGTLPDPTITVGRSGIQWERDSRQDMQMGVASMEAWTLGVSQMFPWPGTLAASEEAAQAQARAAKARYDLGQLRRYLEAKELFLAMAEARDVLAVEVQDLAQVGKLMKFSEERFRQGIGSHMDVLSAHIELALRKANLRAREAALENIKSKAAVMLGESPARPPAFHLVSLAKLAEEHSGAKRSELFGRSDLVRDTIEAGASSAQASKQETVLRAMPGFSISATAAQMKSGEQTVSLMAGISVPLFSHGKRSALRSQIEEIKQEGRSQLAWHDAQKELARTQLEKQRRQLAANLDVLEKEVIPLMEEHLEKALVEYSQGRGALRDIIDSQQALLRQQVAGIQIRRELLQTSLAEIRIDAGFFQGELDPGISSLSLNISSSMGRSMGDAGSGMDMKGPIGNSRPMNGEMPVSPIPGGASMKNQNGPGDEPIPAGGMPGMGM